MSRRREQSAQWPDDDLDDLDDFRVGFEVSRKGNLWRTWRGTTVTVFRARGGGVVVVHPRRQHRALLRWGVRLGGRGV